jgi:1-acyl-sn-glycerol-3-phosphate acyltransferase
VKAGLLRKWWIIFISILMTGEICVRVIFWSLIGKLTQQRVDNIARAWSKRILKIIRLEYALVNDNDVDIAGHDRVMLMCNHSSLYDIPITYVTLPGSIRMLTKKELFKIPLFGFAMKRADFVSIDRQNRKQAILDLKRAHDQMDEGIILWVAPEGTRSRTGKLGPLKKGGFITAIKADATIIPVGIRGANDILPAKTSHFHLHQTVSVHLGAPIKASEYSLENKEALMERVEGELKSLMGETEE